MRACVCVCVCGGGGGYVLSKTLNQVHISPDRTIHIIMLCVCFVLFFSKGLFIAFVYRTQQKHWAVVTVTGRSAKLPWRGHKDTFFPPRRRFQPGPWRDWTCHSPTLPHKPSKSRHSASRHHFATLPHKSATSVRHHFATLPHKSATSVRHHFATLPHKSATSVRHHFATLPHKSATSVRHHFATLPHKSATSRHSTWQTSLCYTATQISNKR